MIEYKLRPYQQETKEFIYSSWRAGKKRSLVLLPTGSGKTVIAGSIIKDALDKGYETLFTCHRIILVNQTYTRFEKFSASVIMGRDKRYNEDALLQIGSVFTIKNRSIKIPKIIIIDEAHFGYKADIIKSLFEKFPNARIIGLSATPIDRKGYLLEGFDAYFDKYQAKDLQDLGFSVPFKVFSPVQIDLSSVGKVGDEYNQGDLEEVMIKEYLLKTVVNGYIKHGESRKFLAYGSTQKHAGLLACAFNDAGIPVGYIDAKTSTSERNLLIKQLELGEIRGIVNIQILIAGFDLPEISCIIDAAPTLILSNYLQRVGRGSRIFPRKNDCIYLDFANNISEHDMPDKRRKFEFKPMVSKVIDRKLGLGDELERDISVVKTEISTEKVVYLKKIGKILDLYEGKVYRLERDLQADINKYLQKTGLFWYRQNSGVAQYSWALRSELKEFSTLKGGNIANIEEFVNFISRGKERFIRFTSKSGLADISCHYGSVFFGIEIKLPKGKLTTHQKETIPEQVSKKVLIFFAESVIDVYDIIVHIENNILEVEGGVLIKESIYLLYDKQIEYYHKHKLKTYKEAGVV